MIYIKFKYFALAIIFLPFLNIYSEENAKSITYITIFEALSDSEQSIQIENTIRSAIKNKLEDQGLTTKALDQKWSAIKTQSLEESGFIVIGFYQKKNGKSNLNIYSQIIDSETKKVIDAFNITDEVYDIVSDKIDPADLLETDNNRINKFASKIAIQIRMNPKKKTNQYNVDEFVLSSQTMKTKNLPIQSTSDSSQTDVFDLMANQVTKSATKISRKTNEAPNIVNIITAEEIEDYGRVSLNDILYQLPGFAASQDYDRRTVSARGTFEGWNNNHLLLLVDGVQFNDSLYGTAYTSEITPLNMIKSVEVIRGPGSALYGSNATNGVVSINTWSGKDLNGDVKIRARGGNAETQIYDILTGGVSKYISYVASYNAYKTNGNNQVSPDGSGRVDEFGFLQKFSIPDKRKTDYIFLKLEGEDFLEGFSAQYHKSGWKFDTGHGWLWRVPDREENMNESRDIVNLRYSGNITSYLSQEYVLQYQERSIDWNIRFAERGAYEDYYPDGNWEILKTGAQNYFSRAQWVLDIGQGASFLFGMEAGVFKYKGDRLHLSDVNYADSINEFPPYEGGVLTPQGPWLEWIQGNNVPSYAAYAQLVSGKFLNKSLELTLGVRYDETKARFKGIDQPYSEFIGSDIPYIPNEEKVFRRTSPRAGLVYFATSQLSFKAMSSTAFRAPSITEMFGANTFTLASNPRELRPEFISTYDLGMDWIFLKYFNYRVNWFWTKFENQIAYSVANNNLSTNIYSLVTRGIENEIIFQFREYSAFLNYSISQRMNEKILDDTIRESPKEITWAPSRTGNIGIRYSASKWMISLSAQAQGRVRRRLSDQTEIDTETNEPIDPLYKFQYPKNRPDSIDPWIHASSKFAYYFTEKISLGISVFNMINKDQYLLKNNLYPFDYRRERRRFLLDFSATF
ncbi:TonB-dependent receptor plug domain-containing protein [Leptospira sp. GIMC2001]|uniref:TonB-dependent receptor plug domain-containing protein n=1 Tax=Leptospira sp. GIMC2001 TaxID=1513297 RepID=UPI00234AD85E|nr:TonB-dependent receptor [Leptospira sp. GIMC2001]WCL47568.1 TonB-dependent receptor [Leptospira sp. GIMC2001]